MNTLNKYKYNYTEYRDKVKVLPTDSNAIALNAVSKLNCDRLNAAITKAQERRYFGEITVHDARDALVCSIELHGGVVKTLKCTDDKIIEPLRVLFLRSHRNELWSFQSKDKKEIVDVKKV